MLCQDIKPSRLDHAKWFLRDLIKATPGDRYGIVAFSGSAFLECPLTIDKTSLFHTLDDLDAEHQGHRRPQRHHAPGMRLQLAARRKQRDAADASCDHRQELPLRADRQRGRPGHPGRAEEEDGRWFRNGSRLLSSIPSKQFNTKSRRLAAGFFLWVGKRYPGSIRPAHPAPLHPGAPAKEVSGRPHASAPGETGCSLERRYISSGRLWPRSCR